MLASLAVAVLFILQSGFRRRLLWSIRVTLVIYAFFFILRLVIWPIFDFDVKTFILIGGLGLGSFLVWLGARWLTLRYIRSRPKQVRQPIDLSRVLRSIFTRWG